ncbi:MAG: alpha-glucosidase/alpha-galactosidase [Janthinobacterium lividum]
MATATIENATEDVIEETEQGAEKEGHIAHSKSAAAKGLMGEMRRPIKLTMMGAGSGFTPTLVRDVLQIPGNQGGTIALVDIDADRLRTMHGLIQKVLDTQGKSEWKVESSTDRSQVLGGSDYVICCVEVSGTACVRFDNDIPAKYGVSQCIGDTIGPGGLFKSLRTIPVWLDILKDVERYAPSAIVLNYTNPMSMMCLAAGRTSYLPVVGLCHSVQGTGHLLAGRAGIAYEEMAWECAGINHLAWFTKLEHQGVNLYSKLMEMAQRDVYGPEDAQGRENSDIVRKDMMLHFGAFITESSGHLSEYLPYYRKRQDLLDKYARAGYDGETSFYADNWPTWRKNADEKRLKMLSGEEGLEQERSWEYGSWIIEAREKDSPVRIHGNVLNSAGDGSGTLITNLPADGIVEVACMIDGNGINPTRYGALPPQMAALCASNMWMYNLGATAAIERSKEAAIHALLLDPHTASVCSPAEIKAMTLEMFDAEAEFLPGYK